MGRVLNWRTKTLIGICALLGATASVAPATTAHALVNFQNNGWSNAGKTMFVVSTARGYGPSVWPHLSDVGARFAEPLSSDIAIVSIPSGDPAAVAALPHVLSVVLSFGTMPGDTRVHGNKLWDPVGDPGSLWNVAQQIDATDYWSRGVYGQGVDVAVIDSGVAPLQEFGDRLINGPDLSFDASSATGGDPDFDGIDALGHGTHMAGIIAGRDINISNDELANPRQFLKDAKRQFVGIAPASRIVNVRVGASDGAVDVSQVIAGIEWVIKHRVDPNIAGGLHIRVLNLSYGTTGGRTDHNHDALAAELERAVKNGILPVVSSGNSGYSATAQLDDPASDPYVVAVGASDAHGTVARNDDSIADYTSRGIQSRPVDVLAPGTSITSLAVPGSVIDNSFPGGRVGNETSGARWFKGSGTSQAAAVVSGAAALLYSDPRLADVRSQQPANQVAWMKEILSGASVTLPTPARRLQRLDHAVKELKLDLAGSVFRTVRHASNLQNVYYSTMKSTHMKLEEARGDSHVQFEDADGVTHTLEGEVTAGGQSWFGMLLADGWYGQKWSNEVYTGPHWDGGEWLGRTWRARAWAGNAWQDSEWSGRTWRNNAWRMAG